MCIPFFHRILHGTFVLMLAYPPGRLWTQCTNRFHVIFNKKSQKPIFWKIGLTVMGSSLHQSKKKITKNFTFFICVYFSGENSMVILSTLKNNYYCPIVSITYWWYMSAP
uniref:Uncharacterized protein n=1 Tax=Cacopsylla melanoneura TaxID=428564 RepID=A0A8D8Y8D5_9HEMI